MRVIAGTAKGRRLLAPKGYEIRPTSDRVKESIFNILGDRPEGAIILDLFAGAGSLGIEALSRGAHVAYFVDSKRNSIDLVKKNLSLTGFLEHAIVMQMDAGRAVNHFIDASIDFDLIFMDPPYRISVAQVASIKERLVSSCMNDGAMLVYEHDSKTEPAAINGLELVSKRDYGDTSVAFYHKEG